MENEDLRAYEVDRDGWHHKAGRLCVSDVDRLREEVL